MRGWIGVDLDGTLDLYDGWRGIEHVGDPVPGPSSCSCSWTLTPSGLDCAFVALLRRLLRT